MIEAPLEPVTAAAPKLVIRSCPLCGADNLGKPALEYAPKAWPVKVCACGMVYLERAPDISELYENLAWEKQFSSENARRHERLGLGEQTIRQALRRFRPFPRKNAVALTAAHAPPGRVIDVGCGSGDHLAALPGQFTPIGIEISAALARKAMIRTASRGGAVVNADALSGLRRLPSSSYSAVIMRSFLEHDINPAPILSEVSRVLAPGGVVVIKVPNYASWNRKVRGARWCGFRFPDHVNYFTPATLRRALSQAGLMIRRFGLLDHPPTSDNMWLIGVQPGAARPSQMRSGRLSPSMSTVAGHRPTDRRWPRATLRHHKVLHPHCDPERMLVGGFVGRGEQQGSIVQT